MMNKTQRGLQLLIRSLVLLENKWWPIQRADISRHVELSQLTAEKLTFVTPYFVLSTGRCGTSWLTELLQMSRHVWINHSEHPQLVRHSRLAYENYATSPILFCEVLRAARDELIINSYKRGQVYIETNNRITFFALAIKEVYPKAKFIHLVRHPGDFVRSGLSRKWYQGHQHDIGRIIKSRQIELWRSMSDIEKIAWLWNETNQYIEDFLSGLPETDYIQIKSEEMFCDSAIAMNICQFIGANDIAADTISKILKRRVNQQRKWAIGPYQTWSDSQKADVRRQASIAAKFGYE